MLKVCLFGALSVSIETDGGAQELELSSRPASLLAFLALGLGRFFPRGQIIQSLWSDAAEPGSSGSFNTALWRLRKIMDRPPLRAKDYIVTNSQNAIGLNGLKNFWLDVEEFARLTRAGLSKPIQQITEADYLDLESAAALYVGDLCTDIPDSWILPDRERYRRGYLNTLGRLMEVAAIRQNYPACIRHAQAILDQDPLREDVHRHLMRYLVLNGQRAMALKQFELCRNSLKRELAIQPMQETVLLYQRIANSAIGEGPALERSLFFNSGPEPAPVPLNIRLPDILDPGPAAQPAPEAAVRYLEEARRLIGEAESLLQLSLSLIDDPASRA